MCSYASLVVVLCCPFEVAAFRRCCFFIPVIWHIVAQNGNRVGGFHKDALRVVELLEFRARADRDGGLGLSVLRPVRMICAIILRCGGRGSLSPSFSDESCMEARGLNGGRGDAVRAAASSLWRSRAASALTSCWLPTTHCKSSRRRMCVSVSASRFGTQ